MNGSRQALVWVRYYGLERLPKIISLNPPLVCLHSFLVRKVLLLLVTAFQNYYHFKPSLKYLKYHQDNDFMSKINLLYLCFNKKKIKTTLGFTVHNARKQIPCLLSSHLLNFIFPQDNFRCQTATSMATWPYMRT